MSASTSSSSASGVPDASSSSTSKTTVSSTPPRRTAASKKGRSKSKKKSASAKKAKAASSGSAAVKGSVDAERAYRQHDIVKLRGLKSKKSWNGKKARIEGRYDASKGRWPVKVTAITGEPTALIKTENIKLLRRGSEWTVDLSSEAQCDYMLLHAYTRDLTAFANLTRRQKSIFHRDFTYKMHDAVTANNVSEFDTRLNALKIKVDRLSKAGLKVDVFLSDKTHVTVVDAVDLKVFNVVVVVDLLQLSEVKHEWVRTTQVSLREGLVHKCEFIGTVVREKQTDEELMGTASSTAKKKKKKADTSASALDDLLGKKQADSSGIGGDLVDDAKIDESSKATLSSVSTSEDKIAPDEATDASQT